MSWTHIVMVIDRSGSMAEMAEEAEQGVNYFIKDQADNEHGDATLSLYKFNYRVKQECDFVPVKDAPKFKLDPHGMTALMDGVGKAISDTKKKFDGIPLLSQPAAVIFVIVTDGKENASQNCTRKQVAAMIKKQRDDDWQFIFLGADDSVYEEAAKLGIDGESTSAYNEKNPAAMYNSVSRAVVRSRNKVAAGQPAGLKFTPEEKKEME